MTAIVAGGDDYELCFTAPSTARDSIEELTDVLGVPLTRIGEIVEGSGVRLVDDEGRTVLASSPETEVLSAMAGRSAPAISARAYWTARLCVP